jgi:DNA-binding LacI/PurR family transcriptional regulator
VRVVGIDDVVQGAFSQPPLSSYRQPLDAMAGCAVELALGRRRHARRFEAIFVGRDSL